MIKTLLISNYALINTLEIDFDGGFNIITGETGAGKSIIMGALGLLLGERADMRAVRDTTRKTVIEAVFGLADAPGVKDAIELQGLGAEGEECILRRELLPGGRSRAFVNDTPVTLPQLREIASGLVDIHSQNQNQLLATPEYQLHVIDSIAGNEALLKDYRQAYTAYRRALKSYTEARDTIRRYRDDADFLAYQFNELEAMDLTSGEQESLEAERDVLQNLDSLLGQLNRALEPLTSEPTNILTAMGEVCGAVDGLALDFDDDEAAETKMPQIDFRALADRASAAKAELVDLADTLADYRASLNAEPGRLEQVEERLAQIYSLENKHHVKDLAGLLEIRNRLASQIATIENGDETVSRLETEAKRAKKAAVALATTLSESRTVAAASFAARLREEAMPLGMPNLRCEVAITHGKLSPDGMDQVQFLFAFNKNQSLIPLGGAASGGEVSRLMLTVKSIVARHMHLPSVIFDEVDTGVSGDVATRMAAMMAGMSRSLQVICITHLPGVAARGAVHFKVFKHDDEHATNTCIKQLDRAEREAELALMLSGDANSESALAAARAMLDRQE